MPRLIEANAIESVFRTLASRYKGSFTGDAYIKALELIKKAPTVEAVEVVRCKDCKHYGDSPYDNGDMMCDRWGEWIFPNDDDFCSYGERKDND